MKYGEYLISQQLPEWREHYLNYDRLKRMIKDMEAAALPFQTDGATGKNNNICGFARNLVQL